MRGKGEQVQTAGGKRECRRAKPMDDGPRRHGLWVARVVGGRLIHASFPCPPVPALSLAQSTPPFTLTSPIDPTSQLANCSLHKSTKEIRFMLCFS